MHRRKTNWLKLLFLAPLIWASPSNSDENTRQIKNATDKLIDHYSNKIIPDINIPDKYKEALPDNFHLKGFNKLTYDFGPEMDYDVSTNPFKPLDKVEFTTEFDSGSGSITYDSDDKLYFQFKKTF